MQLSDMLLLFETKLQKNWLSFKYHQLINEIM